MIVLATVAHLSFGEFYIWLTPPQVNRALPPSVRLALTAITQLQDRDNVVFNQYKVNNRIDHRNSFFCLAVAFRARVHRGGQQLNLSHLNSSLSTLLRLGTHKRLKKIFWGMEVVSSMTARNAASGVMHASAKAQFEPPPVQSTRTGVAPRRRNRLRGKAGGSYIRRRKNTQTIDSHPGVYS